MKQPNTELMEFLGNIPQLSSTERELIAQNINVRLYEKDTFLIRQGDICHQCFFVLRGCLRQYIIQEGIEKTTEFYTEHQSSVLLSEYTAQKPAESFLVCVEDSLLMVGEVGEEAEMYRKFPLLKDITYQFMAQGLGRMQQAMQRFVTSSPEERYVHLLETRPDLLQRVPQHQIASYLGVTPESLSRIRKRLSQKR